MSYKVMIFKDRESNLPYRKFEMPEQYDELMELIEEAKINPGKYRFEISGSFVWEEKETLQYNGYIIPILRVIPDVDSPVMISLVCSFLQNEAIKY